MARLRFLTTAALGTLALALPASLLALGFVAYLDEHLLDISAALRANWPALAREAMARWPEVAGMVIGQLLLMAILVLGGRKVVKLNAEA